MAKTIDAYSLRQVVELTGITEFLLRVWESRYQALSPRRGSTGRRIYSGADLRRVRLLLDLREQGHQIGAIAALSTAKLENLLAPAPAAITHAPATEADGIFSAADRGDWASVRAQMEAALERFSPEAFLLEFLAPLLQQMGARVAAGRFSISQEHVLSGLSRELLASLRRPTKKSRAPSRLILATPDGDYHDLGLWIALRLANLAGWDALYVGASVPSRDLAETAVHFKATHVLLASTVSAQLGAKQELPQYLSFLDRHLPPTVALWTAGSNASAHPLKLARPFRLFHSFAELWQEMRHGH